MQPIYESNIKTCKKDLLIEWIFKYEFKFVNGLR